MTPRRTGWVAFGGTLVIGIIATQAGVHELLKEMPREEVYEAIARDSLAVGYTLVGWFITFIVAVILGLFASQCVPPEA